MERETVQQRDTVQRRAIRALLKSAGRPLSPKEVLEGARLRVPSLGMATVYRTLNALVQEEWAVPVELPGEAPRYEMAGKSHHHHFHCRSCDQVYEVHGCSGVEASGVPAGFRVESHEVVLYGSCSECID